MEGFCSPRFEPVREEFERNFASRGELGASACVIVDGEPVVDLWGGVADPSTGARWQRDTMNVLFSATKGLAALCGNVLIDRGQLDPDRPIAHYWPEFGQAGKADIPVRMVFNHQSGVAHVDQPVPAHGLDDWTSIIGMLERTTPFWAPGQRHGYHAISIGFLIGELVRRVTGSTIGTFLRKDIAEPLELDLWIGLPEEHEERVAPSIAFDPTTEPVPATVLERMADPEAPLAKIINNMGGWFQAPDRRRAHAAEIPAGGGIGNARSLAGMYAPLSLDGSIGGVRIVQPEAIAVMGHVQSAGWDVVLGNRSTFSMGFSNCWWGNEPGDGSTVILGEDAFGTPGAGGQLGFADPAHRLAFGYTMNKHGVGTALNDRGQSLVDATYRVLGSPSNAPGFWVRPR